MLNHVSLQGDREAGVHLGVMVQGCKHQVVDIHPDETPPVRGVMLRVAFAVEAGPCAEGAQAEGRLDLPGPQVVQLSCKLWAFGGQ